MKITVLQSNPTFSYDVNSPGDYDLETCKRLSDAFLDKELARMEAYLQQGTKLLVTIEGLNASVSPNDPRYDYATIAEPLDGPLMQKFSALTKQYDAYIVAGLYTSQQGKAYNSAILFGPEGIVGVHNKVHLPAGEEIGITPGDKFEIFPTPYGNIGMLVCWDLQFPEAARELALLGADLIACPTWGCELKYVPCRAYENSVTLAVAMGIPHGIPLWEGCDPSCIVDNMGNVLGIANRETADAVTVDVDILAEPAPQYGSETFTGFTSMRRTRLIQRRPDTYKEVVAPSPALRKRYEES